MTERRIWRRALWAATCALSMTTADAGVNAWTPTGPDGGFVSSITWHPARPGVAFASFGMRIHRTTDGGLHWLPVTSHDVLAYGGVVVDPKNPDRVFGAAFEIVRSDDGGATFQTLQALPGNPQVSQLAFGPGGNALYALGSCSVFRSGDLAGTWTPLSTGLPSTCLSDIGRDLLVDRARPGRLYVAMQDTGLYRSLDDGAHWTPAGPAPGQARVVEQNPFDPDELLLSQDAGLWRSTDGGDSWSLVRAGSVSQLAFDPLRPGRAIATIDGKLWQSSNAGVSWTQGIAIGSTGAPANVASFSPHVAGELLVGTDQGLWHGIDDGTALTPRNTGARAGNSRASAVAGPKIYVAVDAGPDLVLRRSGADWVSTHTAELRDALRLSTALSLAAHPSNPSVVYAGGLTLAKSLDRGETWFSPAPTLQGYINSIAIDPFDPEVIYVVAPSTGVQRSADGGATWVVRSSGLPTNAGKVTASKVYASPHRAGELYVVTNEPTGLYRSSDAGLTWTQVPAAPSYLNGLTFDPVDPEVLYATASPGVHRSANRGASWTRLPLEDLNLESIAFDPEVPTNVFVSSSRTFGGTWRSVDGGKGWELITAGTVPTGPLHGLVFDPAGSHHLFASASYRGLVELSLATDLELTAAGAEGDWTSGVPQSLELTALNRGPYAASNVVLTLTLPSGWSMGAAAMTRGKCAEIAGGLRCAVGPLLKNARTTLIVPVTATSNAMLDASVTAHEMELAAGDNAVSVAVSLKSASPVAPSTPSTPSTPSVPVAAPSATSGGDAAPGGTGEGGGGSMELATLLILAAALAAGNRARLGRSTRCFYWWS